MRHPQPSTVDFETHAIADRPHYPPVPAGVSVKHWGKPPRYYAWGHLTDNNSTWAEARAAVAAAYRNTDGVCFHHGKFDLDVAETHLGLAPPPWDRCHDTMFLAYLDDPHQRDLGLKPQAVRVLGEPPEERDAVIEWLVTHQPVPGIKISRSKQSPHYAMKYLPWAPGGLVGTYANSDTTRTEGLFKALWKKTVVEREMAEPYDRERRLQPLLLAAERRGLAVPMDRLEADVASYGQVLTNLDRWLFKRLGTELNLDSGDQLIEHLLRGGLADESLVGLTAKGKLRSDKETLQGAVTDPQLGAALAYRAGLVTCLRTYLVNWWEMAQASGGTIHTNFHQTRGDDGGTRTGRLSCTWFMNMPKVFEPLFKDSGHPRHPAAPLKGLPLLPRCRSYIVPRKGYIFIDRDYSQQEPRILAHFDGKLLLNAYVADPWIDFHDYAKAELEKMGLFYERKPVKNTNLGLIYGMGVPKLAAKNGMTVGDAGTLKAAVLQLYPGLADMYKEMKRRARVGEPIRTWGGREYYCEAPRVVEGRLRTYDYKLVNLLIQGSGADCTKEAILAYHELKHPDDHYLLPVHDQNLAEVPAGRRDDGMARLKQAMESVKFEVPMLSEGDWSATSWADLEPYDKKGKRV